MIREHPDSFILNKINWNSHFCVSCLNFKTSGGFAVVLALVSVPCSVCILNLWNTKARLGKVPRKVSHAPQQIRWNVFSALVYPGGSRRLVRWGTDAPWLCRNPLSGSLWRPLPAEAAEAQSPTWQNELPFMCVLRFQWRDQQQLFVDLKDG